MLRAWHLGIAVCRDRYCCCRCCHSPLHATPCAAQHHTWPCALYHRRCCCAAPTNWPWMRRRAACTTRCASCAAWCRSALLAPAIPLRLAFAACSMLHAWSLWVVCCCCFHSHSVNRPCLLARHQGVAWNSVVVAAQICVPCAPYLLVHNTCPPPPCVLPQKRYLIAGGGSAEMELSYQLSQHAKTLVVRGWAALGGTARRHCCALLPVSRCSGPRRVVSGMLAWSSAVPCNGRLSYQCTPATATLLPAGNGVILRARLCRGAGDHPIHTGRECGAAPHRHRDGAAQRACAGAAAPRWVQGSVGAQRSAAG